MTEPIDETSLNAVAFLYLACGKAPDGDLTVDESAVISERLHAWAPNLSQEYVDSFLVEAVRTWGRLEGPEALLKEIEATATVLVDSLGKEAQRAQVIEDLIGIAQADGRVAPEEESFIIAAAKTLGVELTRDA